MSEAVLPAFAAHPVGGSQPRSFRLKPHVDSYRHVYQGKVWYVFHDRAAHRYYRVSGEGAEMLGALDGRRGLEDVFKALQARNPETAPDAQAVLQFIHHLNALELLRSDTVPDVARLDARNTALRRRKFFQSLRSPLSLKFRLLDPTDLLSRLLPWLGWIFGPAGLLLWLAVVSMGALIGLMHWQELTADFSDRLLTMENIALASLAYPIIKVLHELGHGLALRRLGGEVREVGILFAAFMPVPYVDASASAVLVRRGDRMLVGAAGIMVEMFLGSIALLVWSQAEAGAIRVICYNIIVISGFSTLLFNGNPLQRYDGYYILTDLLGIPGLGMRSGQYLSGLFRRHVLGEANVVLPMANGAERWWFAFYGPTSFLYRLMLMLVIAFFVAEHYPGLGFLLAGWSLLGYLAPAATGLVGAVRRIGPDGPRRGLVVVPLAIVTVAVLLFVLPAPQTLVVQGVVVMPEEATLRPAVAGVVVSMIQLPGAQVQKFDPLIQLEESSLEMRRLRARAEVDEWRARQIEAVAIDPGHAEASAEQLRHARQRLADADRDAAALVVRSPSEGVLLAARASDLPGRYVTRGETLGAIWSADRAVIRAVAPASWIADLRAGVNRGSTAEVRPGWDVLQSFTAEVVELVPQASDILPSAVLSIEGGGPFATTRGADGILRAAEALFEVVLRPHGGIPVRFLNGRVHVRFMLEPAPVGLQLWRQLRLLFLRRLNA